MEWLVAPVELVLGPAEVHVWRAWLEQPDNLFDQLARTLSEDERARAARFKFEKDRRAYTIARGVLRALLGRYLGRRPEEVGFIYTPHNKPLLAEASPLSFNLSHSHQLALLAFTLDRLVGVDVEYVRAMPDAAGLAERFFSPAEYAAWRAVPAEQQPLAFFNCWTRKEAFVKALGEGLTHPLDQFDVSLAPGEAARLLAVAGSRAEAARWSLAAFTPAFHYAAAVAVQERGPLLIRGFEWPG
ncbi:MAG: 4'-phosphopantetheinyl transferase superfamily protein [Chloroflexi bacterium]|nr:4'-phosphopantetheinyl transferase superfamily protein [Chloroflexota bacterium]MCI0576220.1 4'-phosphopantetheinyl transferase superfamily protein [Chloroflexota bacterium]MCI0645486.1 4'-phosphopantetheinyl transferase superfamily protein [Chloroflexota bacterium]MCI0730625.1 4'-phosphopantetheinyl transferase superfamily protein [Chloroflexota bacterium]